MSRSPQKLSPQKFSPSLSEEERRRRRRETLVILAAGLAVAVFAAWEIRSPVGHGAAGNVISFLLINLNIVLLLVMVFLVLRNLTKIITERRQRVPGSHLRGRLVLAFVAIALFPASLMLLVMRGFVLHNIDDWLGSEVEESLAGAYELARVYYADSAEEALRHARALAQEAARFDLTTSRGRKQLADAVARYQRAYELGTVQVLDAAGDQVLVRFSEQAPGTVPEFPAPELLANIRLGREATEVESYGERDVIRAAAPVRWSVNRLDRGPPGGNARGAGSAASTAEFTGGAGGSANPDTAGGTPRGPAIENTAPGSIAPDSIALNETASKDAAPKGTAAKGSALKGAASKGIPPKETGPGDTAPKNPVPQARGGQASGGEVYSSEAYGPEAYGTVVVEFFVSEPARGWSEDILASFREFRQLKLNRQPFKNLYALTLALAAVVVVFSAAWVGIYMARGITEPIGRLAGATRAISEGDWDVELEEAGGDEIGMLVSAFNSMTSEVRRTHHDLEERRIYIESILNNVDAGVISIDEQGVLDTVNPAAASLLGIDANNAAGQDGAKLFVGAGFDEIAALLDRIDREENSGALRVNVHREEEGRTLLVTAAPLVVGEERAGCVLVVENVSQIVEVQRMAAWREVARRIAHEIKNPLTPIQLSAQRLARRLRDRVEPDDARVLNECVDAIVSEVDALKKLVNEFSHFARQSTGEKLPHDLNELVGETLPIFRQAHPDVEIVFEAGEGLPAVAMNRDAVKRALVNLVDNAVSAVEEVGAGAPTDPSERAVPAGPESGRVEVRTEFDRDLSRVRLEVCDNGPGIPLAVRQRVFEPYFSTKASGTGLGLAIVSSVAADHQAYVRVHENEPRGSRFVIELPVPV